MTYAAGHPLRREGQPLAEHQAEMARWMGYATVEELNADHDPLHAALCQWLGVPSYSLMIAQGVALDAKRMRLANLEEVAVLTIQRFIANLRQEGELDQCSTIF